MSSLTAIPRAITVEEFQQVYRGSFTSTEKGLTFSPYDFLDQYGAKQVDMQGLKGRINLCERMRNVGFVAILVTLVVGFLFLKMRPLAFALIPFLIVGTAMASLEAFSLKELQALHECEKKDGKVLLHNLLTAGREALQRAWEGGCVTEKTLLLAKEAINEMGEAIVITTGDALAEIQNRFNSKIGGDPSENV